MPAVSTSSLLSYRREWNPDDALHAALARIILSRRLKDPGLKVANVDGWHSTPDLVRWNQPEVAALLDRIRAGAEAIGADALRVQAWANVMRKGSYQLAHQHGEAVWSGVYYLDDGGAGGGAITFARGDASITIQPTAGLILIFPGDLRHSVGEYQGEGTRISVAFNLS